MVCEWCACQTADGQYVLYHDGQVVREFFVNGDRFTFDPILTGSEAEIAFSDDKLKVLKVWLPKLQGSQNNSNEMKIRSHLNANHTQGVLDANCLVSAEVIMEIVITDPRNPHMKLPTELRAFRMDAARGDVCNLMGELVSFTLAKNLMIFCQICCACLFLHANGIVHGDIKSENVVFDKNNNANLLDFGYSQFEGDDSTRSPQFGRGSPPDTDVPMNRDERVAVLQKSDVFSVTALFRMMLMCWHHSDDPEVRTLQESLTPFFWAGQPFGLLKSPNVFRKQFEKFNIPNKLQKILIHALNIDWRKRLSMSDLTIGMLEIYKESIGELPKSEQQAHRDEFQRLKRLCTVHVLTIAVADELSQKERSITRARDAKIVDDQARYLAENLKKCEQCNREWNVNCVVVAVLVVIVSYWIFL